MHSFPVLAAGAALVVTLTACGSSSKSGGGSAGSNKVPFTLTADGCNPASLQLPAGAATFEVKNDGADAVSEMELIQNGRIVGEVENLTPGLSGSFSVTLSPGTYETSCPNGKTTPKGQLLVKGNVTATTVASATATSAVAQYRMYAEEEATQLVTATAAFVDAVKAGDVAKAKELYPTARSHYESIEPIAESFGDLDPEIDARINDVPANQFKGFHRIEQQLWQAGNTDGMAPVADGLLTNVKKLESLIPTIKLEPAQIANGAVELMNEVASSKITGEEDRYSHTDLWDFDANDDGAKVAFDAVRPLVAAKNPALADTVDQQFESTEHALDAYKTATGFKLYTELSQAQTRALAAQVEALADSLSKVSPLIVGS